MSLYLKRYLPIVKTHSRLKIGVKREYIDMEYSDELMPSLEKLINEGVTEEDIQQNSLYAEMFEKNMLTKDNARQRKEMFLDYLGVELDPKKLDTPILCLGVGGMGSNTAYLLAQFGFKNITIVDFDTVETSDIEKMMVYRNEHLGMYKDEALKQIIETQFEYCKVDIVHEKITSKEQLEGIIEDAKAGFVIKAMDPKEIAFRIWLNDICFAKRIPFINCSYSFEFIRFGPFFAPGLTQCCDNCYRLWHLDSLGEEYNINKMEKLFHSYTTHPAISFNINIASNLSVKDIIFFMAGRYEYVSSLAAIIDYKSIDLSGESTIISRHKDCQVCKEVVEVA
jgi:hypothetical protein